MIDVVVDDDDGDDDDDDDDDDDEDAPFPSGTAQYTNSRLWCGCQNGRILVLNVEVAALFRLEGDITFVFQLQGNERNYRLSQQQFFLIPSRRF